MIPRYFFKIKYEKINKPSYEPNTEKFKKKSKLGKAPRVKFSPDPGNARGKHLALFPDASFQPG